MRWNSSCGASSMRIRAARFAILIQRRCRRVIRRRLRSITGSFPAARTREVGLFELDLGYHECGIALVPAIGEIVEGQAERFGCAGGQRACGLTDDGHAFAL